MGRILPDTRVTSANVRHYIEQATKDYSTFLNSAPTFCTYFSKNHLKSTFDRGLENINETIGADSPLVFDQVENLPIYKIENASFGTEITDFGIVGTVASSAIILPNTILPSIDDIFELEYQNVRKVFIVTDVEQDNYNNSKYYKITFRLSSFNIEDVENQINDEFTVDYNLIGKTSDPIIKKTDFDLYLLLEDAYDELLDKYNEEFLSKDFDVYAFKPYQTLFNPTIDEYLNYFILKNNLNEGFKIYRKFKYIDIDVSSRIKASKYRRSIYTFIELHPLQNPTDIRIVNSERLYSASLDSTFKYSKNWFAKVNHYIMKPLDIGLTSEIEIRPYSEELMEKIETNSLIDTSKLEEFIIKHFNGYFDKSNYNEIFKILNEADENINDYYLIPLSLYIIRKYHKEIIARPNVN